MYLYGIYEEIVAEILSELAEDFTVNSQDYFFRRKAHPRPGSCFLDHVKES
jgi:hypothetical protein